MANSLFEQLKKTGLVDKKKAHKVRTEKHRLVKQQHQHKNSVPAAESEAAQRIAQAQQEKQQRDRQLNADLKAAADSKALDAQIRQLIEAHRQSRGVNQNSEDGISYNFVEKNVVKKIIVSEMVQQQLSRGQLAIVRYGGAYELVPIVVAEKIVSRSPDYFVTQNAPVEVEDEADPYKDYKIPDDLMW